MKKKIIILSFYIFISVMVSSLLQLANVSADETLVVKVRPFREKNIDHTIEYKYQLLELLLSKTKSQGGPYRIEVAGEELIRQSRVFDLVNQGTLTLIMTMTSKERENVLLPVRIPIYKGLYGYRIFIINEKDQSKFARIKTRNELEQLWAGQGHDWPDLEILKYNNFNVVEGSNYRGLFGMLEEGRFDYFPRGVPEPWREIEEESDRNLMVESTLMVQYFAPAYIFVAKTNTRLAKRLSKGFEMAIKDGSFHRFFENHWYIKETLKRAGLKNRKLFRLKNPLLTPETPLARKELWYSP
jgi:hypothetical protein